ncbi:hypothetical protein B0T25DRAFT_437335, partial [Lasiosphaeria hispida]
NLYDFMAQARPDESFSDDNASHPLIHEVGPLWIDAMCINQNSNPEKSQQVALMSRIYAAAQRIVMWL